MKKLYFKVYTDFTKYIPIDETELEKALYAFQTGKPVIFENGATSRIESILPDFNRSLGWFSDYKTSAEDNVDIFKITPRYIGHIGEVKKKIQFLISVGKTNLIGKNVDILEIEKDVPNLIEKANT